MPISNRWIPAACLLVAACGGADATGPGNVPHPSVANALALGDGFSCALTDVGQAYCWGLNSGGQLGNGTMTTSGGPVAVATSARFTAIAAAYRSACALATDGSVSCWGSLPAGMTSAGTTNATTPVPVTTTLAFASISVGARFACGLTATGAAYCWGAGAQGQLGNGATDSSATPVAVSGGITLASLTVGFWSACGLTAGGAAYCWGDNLYGELGLGTTSARSATPVPVSGGITFRTLDVGSLNACGVATDGTAYCWGFNSVGQIGDGTVVNRTAPTRVAGNLSFARVRSARGNSTVLHACGLTTGGALYCWGYNNKGQLGATTGDMCPGNVQQYACSMSPVAVASLGAVAGFDAGAQHTCAITTDGTAMCWGDDSTAELGDGTNVGHATPATVVGNLHFP